jgi:beta-glucanase (GH16 family)
MAKLTVKRADRLQARNPAAPLCEALEGRRLMAVDAGSGLSGTYFNNLNLSGTTVARIDPKIDFNFGLTSPVSGIAAGTYSVRWRGQVQPRHSETYTFYTTGNDGVRLWINGRQLVDDWRDHAATLKSGRITLAAGRKYDIKLEYYQNTGGAQVKLEWESPSQAREVVPTSQLYPEFSDDPIGVTGIVPITKRASARAADVLGIGLLEKGEWFGRSVLGIDVLTMNTYAGDANLDGQVNGDDYFQLDSNVLLSGVVSGWAKGDFTGDGQINGDDYFLIDNNLAAAAGNEPLRPDSGPPASLAGDWQMIFRDEFSGDTLDPVWHTAQYWDHDSTVVGWDEMQVYDPSAVSLSGGQLHITAREEDLEGMPYVSGLIQTGGDITVSGEQKFSFLHGYLEFRAKLPRGQGFWPAVWMMPASYNDDNGELDVLEVLGSDPTRANFNLHRNGDNEGEEWVGPDFTAGFHTFGVDWQADHVTWYVDGVERARITDPSLISPEAMYPIINVALGGWDGPPDATTPFPSTMDVDYLRVWQQKD